MDKTVQKYSFNPAFPLRVRLIDNYIDWLNWYFKLHSNSRVYFDWKDAWTKYHVTSPENYKIIEQNLIDWKFFASPVTPKLQDLIDKYQHYEKGNYGEWDE